MHRGVCAKPAQKRVLPDSSRLLQCLKSLGHHRNTYRKRGDCDHVGRYNHTGPQPHARRSQSVEQGTDHHPAGGHTPQLRDALLLHRDAISPNLRDSTLWGGFQLLDVFQRSAGEDSKNPQNLQQRYTD